jgi:hypothetical protein
MDTVLVAASPFIDTKCSNKAKVELYNISFDYQKIANPFGERPVNNHGFWESDEGYNDRLKEWEEAEKNVLFGGWVCKDLHQFQELRTKNVIVTLETMTYEVNYCGKSFIFPQLPETIDDFINDLKRIGITIFWKQEIADIYGIDNVTSNQKIIDYYSLLKNIDGSSS